MKTFTQVIIRETEVLLQYKNELGVEAQKILTPAAFFSGQLINNSEFNSIINTNLNDIPKEFYKVYNCSLNDGKFVIQGETLSPKRLLVDNLSNSTLVTGTNKSQVMVFNELASAVQSLTGSPLTSLVAPFNTGKLSINNGDFLNYSDLLQTSEIIFKNATQLAIDLFNE